MLYPTELVIYHLAWWLTGSIYWQRAGVHEYRLCPFSQNNFVLMPVIGVRFQSFPSQTPEMLLTWNIIGVAKSRFFTWANTVKCHLSLRPTPPLAKYARTKIKGFVSATTAIGHFRVPPGLCIKHCTAPRQLKNVWVWNPQLFPCWVEKSTRVNTSMKMPFQLQGRNI